MDIELLFDYLCTLGGLSHPFDMLTYDMNGSPPSSDSNSGAATQQRVNTTRLVLFDFDGTLTRKDTLIEFARFYRGALKFTLTILRLVPVLVLFTFKMLPNWKVKQYFLSRFFKGEKIADFNSQCVHFSVNILPGLIRPEAKRVLERYRAQHATIAVVSASAENWVKPWCDQHGIVCLATQLEIKDGLITGKILGKNCYGDEKVCRVKDHFNLADYDEVIAYGDSRGDREMLALAHRRYYKPFRG